MKTQKSGKSSKAAIKAKPKKSTPKPKPRPIGTGEIAHVVVVMMENRSFDNLVGWLYDENNPPKNEINSKDDDPYHNYFLKDHYYWCPKNAKYILKRGRSWPDYEKVPERFRVYATKHPRAFTIPNPDPLEQFRHMNYQLFGKTNVIQSKSGEANMKGFVVNYRKALRDAGNKHEKGFENIMKTYSPKQLPVLRDLAKNFAICYRWFASAPCQTWPNRAFVHAGTSCGRVNNLDGPKDSNWPPNNKYYKNAKTIFNVLEEAKVEWGVFSEGVVSLTHFQFRKLWRPKMDIHFHNFSHFQKLASKGSLPNYSFIEPSFLGKKNDYHPPHDITRGEQFLYDVWKAVSKSPAWEKTLLVITFDEHGGCYDHVPPPWGAECPDKSKPQDPNPGVNKFHFKRYGVRVPTIIVSPFVEAGTVFRANTRNGGAEFDHTSILATLRDWLDLRGRNWLKSKRIENAPTLDCVLTLSTPRKDIPKILLPKTIKAKPNEKTPLNDIQRSIVAASLMGSNKYSVKAFESAAKVVGKMKTVEDALSILNQ